MHGLELKVPPVLVVILMAVVMWSVSLYTPALAFTFPGSVLLAASAAIAGVIASASGVVSFQRAGTSVNPLKPGSSSSLVCSGMYAFTRNPMYLGFLLMLVGWSIYLSNVLAFLVVPSFILYLDRFQIEPEERALSVRFGQEFVSYRARVRRWL
jgi:protein-S-isoprenylcysteine O-methyltransferase Ste14